MVNNITSNTIEIDSTGWKKLERCFVMDHKTVRVLQIIGLACGGGVESVIMNYYRNIDKDKVQFDFVVHKNPLKSFVDEAEKYGGKVYEVTPYKKNIFAFTYEIYKIIKNGHYNIIHSNMNSLSGFPLFAAWLAGARVRILHNHTTDTKAEGLRTVLKRMLRPFAKMFANKYWACSKFAAEWMYGKKAVDAGKVTIINNAIDLDKFAFNQEKRDKLRKELGLEGKFVIGHVGRFMKQKNHEFLIDIFAEVAKQKDNAVLLLIGDGPLVESIKNKVGNFHLADKVLFLGVRNDVADLYNVMDVFLFPSLYEGLGMVAVEAQVNGLSVVASTEVPVEAKVSDNIKWLTLNMEAKKWEKEILSVKRVPLAETLKSMQKAGFDISIEARKLENEYLTI